MSRPGLKASFPSRLKGKLISAACVRSCRGSLGQKPEIKYPKGRRNRFWPFRDAFVSALRCHFLTASLPPWRSHKLANFNFPLDLRGFSRVSCPNSPSCCLPFLSQRFALILPHLLWQRSGGGGKFMTASLWGFLSAVFRSLHLENFAAARLAQNFSFYVRTVSRH